MFDHCFKRISPKCPRRIPDVGSMNTAHVLLFKAPQLFQQEVLALA